MSQRALPMGLSSRALKEGTPPSPAVATGTDIVVGGIILFIIELTDSVGQIMYRAGKQVAGPFPPSTQMITAKASKTESKKEIILLHALPEHSERTFLFNPLSLLHCHLVYCCLHILQWNYKNIFEGLVCPVADEKPIQQSLCNAFSLYGICYEW